MNRVHSAVPQSGQIMFVDATGSLDRCNHQLLKLMTESPVGGLPLGFIILSEQTEIALSAGLEEIKKLLLLKLSQEEELKQDQKSLLLMMTQ